MATKLGTRRRERLAQLTERAMYQFERSPNIYRLRLAGLAAVGTFVRAGVALLAVGGVLGVIVLALSSGDPWQFLVERKIALLLLPLAWLLWRGLRTKVAPSKGYVLRPPDFPQLFADIAVARAHVQAPRIDHVLLTDEFELRIEQAPRLGLFGWNRKTLFVGLPLLLALTLDEVRALLGHELAHLSRAHDRFAGRIYRLRASWQRFLEALDSAGGRTFALLRRFVRRYAPYFGAYSFALARANEYTADALAAKITSPRATAMALVATQVQVGLLDERYWQPLLERAHADPEPAADAYSGLHRFVRSYTVARSEVLTRIRRAMRRTADDEDTHPSLRERLDAIGAPPELPGAIEVSASENWLAPNLEKVLVEFDTRWRTQHLEQWRERHARAQAAHARIQELESKPITARSPQEDWELATLADTYQPDTDPLARYRAFLDRYPDNFDARLAVGRLLAKGGDARALPLLQSVLDSFHHVIPACEAAYAFYKDRGDESAAGLWDERAGSQLELYERAYRQRSRLSRGDDFFAARLAPEQLEPLRRTLLGLIRVRHAWICEKHVSLLPEQPVYLLIVESREWFSESDSLLNTIRDEVNLPGTLFVLGKRGNQDELITKVMRARTSVV